MSSQSIGAVWLRGVAHDFLVSFLDCLKYVARDTKEYLVSRADIREGAQGQGSLGREHYSIYCPDLHHDGMLVRTTGDAIFEWGLRTLK